ncbi:MAG: phosphatase PAP2 family protein [Candidatus Colwellbacteria bacterium]|nr:phosphatase PAP2 family protein [Candidatus Colwellbacteria bacterium]
METLVVWNKTVFSLLFSLGSATNVARPFWALAASFAPYLLTAFFIVFIISLRGFKARFYFIALTLLAVVLSAGIATEAVRYFFPSSRPFVEFGLAAPLGHDGGGSMPSRHMTFLTPLALALYLAERRGLTRPRAFLWFGAAVLVVGIARIVLALHYPGDILAGALIGAASFLIARKLLPEPAKRA